MAGYRVFFKSSVEKEFSAIPKKDVKRILDRIKTLEDNPRPISCEKITGQEKHRLRRGRYRIVFSIQDEELTAWVVKVGHRKDIYR